MSNILRGGTLLSSWAELAAQCAAGRQSLHQQSSPADLRHTKIQNNNNAIPFNLQTTYWSENYLLNCNDLNCVKFISAMA